MVTEDEESTIEEQEITEAAVDHQAELADLAKEGMSHIPVEYRERCAAVILFILTSTPNHCSGSRNGRALFFFLHVIFSDTCGFSRCTCV